MHAETYLREVISVAREMSVYDIERLAGELAELRGRKGRLFMIGFGGGAANCTHAAADLRMLCGLNTWSLCDSLDEFSAISNDTSPAAVFSTMLESRDLCEKDAVLILSVGGGTPDVSRAIVAALGIARDRKARIFGIVGHKGGMTAEMADVAVRVPMVNERHVTPHTEAFQAVIWHALCCHPMLQKNPTKW